MKNRLSVIGYRLLGIRENKVKGNEFRVQVLNRLIIIDLNSSRSLRSLFIYP